MDAYSFSLAGFIGTGLMATLMFLPGLFKDAFAPQPGLEPDWFERLPMTLAVWMKRARNSGPRLIRHHGVKLYHIWLRWQGYKPLVLNRRTVWVPTHTILTPHEVF